MNLDGSLFGNGILIIRFLMLVSAIVHLLIGPFFLMVFPTHQANYES
jgi:hypothetical protein